MRTLIQKSVINTPPRHRGGNRMAALLATVAITACPAGLLDAAVIDNFEGPVKYIPGGFDTNSVPPGLINGQLVFAGQFTGQTLPSYPFAHFDNIGWTNSLPGAIPEGSTLEVRMDLLSASADDVFLMLAVETSWIGAGYVVFVDQNEVGLWKYGGYVAVPFWINAPVTNQNATVALALTLRTNTLQVTTRVVNKDTGQLLFQQSFLDGPGSDCAVPVPPPKGMTFFVPDPGAPYTNFTAVWAGVFQWTTTNPAPVQVVMDNLEYNLYTPPRITGTYFPTNWPPVSVGASVANRVLAYGSPTPSYQWCLNGTPVPGQTNNTILLNNVQLSDAGDYTAVATNLAGSATSRVVTLTVDATFTKITTGPVVTDSGGWVTPAWLDYDNDGFLDLYVANTLSGGLARDAVYHNNRDGTFSRVTNAINLLLSGSAAGAVGDYNNDDLEDLLTIHWGDAADLYRNVGGGNFTRLTGSQVGQIVTDPCGDAGWADYDLDGFLDLFVANYKEGFLNDCLYHNNGDRPFTRMTASQVGGLVADNAITSPCAWVDYDNDGWPDLWVGTGLRGDTGRQYLWHNDNGKFSQVLAGSLTNNLANSGGQWADYDNDGYLDLFLTSFGRSNSLHHNLMGQTFIDVSTEAGVAKAVDAWCAAWGDYDNDGYLDLMVIGYYPTTQSVLYHNNGNGTFTSVEVGSPLRDGGPARQGVAWADYDNDGFLDLLLNCSNPEATTKSLLYRNNGNGNAWLKVKLVGLASNRSAIGAKVRVQTNIRGQTVRQMREMSGNSGLSGSSGGLLAHFGLGDATNVDLVRIEWPSGVVQQLTNVPSRQSLTVTEHQEEATTPLSLAALRSADGKVQMSVTGQTNLLYVFEASTNLVKWTKIAVRTNLTGTLEFTPATSSGPRQFYRVLMP